MTTNAAALTRQTELTVHSLTRPNLWYFRRLPAHRAARYPQAAQEIRTLLRNCHERHCRDQVIHYSAIASLLNSSLSSQAAPAPQAAQSSASPSSGPSDSVDLSDHAKALLAQAQQDQVLANKLQSLLQSAKNPNSNSDSSDSGQSSDDNVLQVFDQLTGQSQSQTGSSSYVSLNDCLNVYANDLADQNTGPDGTVGGFSQTLHDVELTAPSTPQQISTWYNSLDTKALAGAAQAWPDNDPGLAEALASHSVTFLNASEIPDLNFHNTISIQGGDGGVSINESYTYSHNAAIFSDPTTSYKVLDDGTVLAWKKPSGTGTAVAVS
jgi:hypothetical protein